MLTKTNTSTRESILAAEKFISELPNATLGDSPDCELTHEFTDGIYVRTLRIPKGMVIAGKIHKHGHPNFLMSGTVKVVIEHEGVETYVGPKRMISEAGTKRILYTETDVVWTTIHHNPTNTQDPIKLEKEVIAPSYEAYDKYIESKKPLLERIINKLKRRTF